MSEARRLAGAAADAGGATQPMQPIWNRLGYANHGEHRVRVRIR